MPFPRRESGTYAESVRKQRELEGDLRKLKLENALLQAAVEDRFVLFIFFSRLRSSAYLPSSLSLYLFPLLPAHPLIFSLFPSLASLRVTLPQRRRTRPAPPLRATPRPVHRIGRTGRARAKQGAGRARGLGEASRLRKEEEFPRRRVVVGRRARRGRRWRGECGGHREEVGAGRLVAELEGEGGGEVKRFGSLFSSRLYLSSSLLSLCRFATLCFFSRSCFLRRKGRGSDPFHRAEKGRESDERICASCY
jgi:hypothetical protein